MQLLLGGGDAGLVRMGAGGSGSNGLLCRPVAPITGRPLPAGDDHFRETAGMPRVTRRHLPPETAYPDKLILIVVPLPVAGDPLHVVAGGLLIRRYLVNEGWWFFGCERSRLRLNALSTGWAKASWSGPRACTSTPGCAIGAASARANVNEGPRTSAPAPISAKIQGRNMVVSPRGGFGRFDGRFSSSP